GEEGAAGEALQIDYPIELLGAHPLNASPKLTPVTRRCPPMAVKGHNAREVRIFFQQWGEIRINPPMNFAGREMKFEQPQHGERVYYVSQRTGIENEDFQCSGSHVHRRSGRDLFKARELFAESEAFGKSWRQPSIQDFLLSSGDIVFKAAQFDRAFIDI